MIQCHDFRLKIKDELLFTCDLNFKKGFVYVIKGENGSGKTSFLRALKGLFMYEGQLEIQGYSDISTPTFPSFSETCQG